MIWSAGSVDAQRVGRQAGNAPAALPHLHAGGPLPYPACGIQRHVVGSAFDRTGVRDVVGRIKTADAVERHARLTRTARRGCEESVARRR